LLTIRADYDGYIPESDETNNSATIGFTVCTDAMRNLADVWSVCLGDEVRFTAEPAYPQCITEPLSFGLDPEPAGASIDPTTGEFSWTPTALGETDLDVLMFHGGRRIRQAITIKVIDCHTSQPPPDTPPPVQDPCEYTPDAHVEPYSGGQALLVGTAIKVTDPNATAGSINPQKTAAEMHNPGPVGAWVNVYCLPDGEGIVTSPGSTRIVWSSGSVHAFALVRDLDAPWVHVFRVQDASAVVSSSLCDEVQFIGNRVEIWNSSNPAQKWSFDL
jgi:hypothetical protein